MEYGSIEREIYVDASPEVVYEVISKPEHMREWWPDEARFEPATGSTGELSWRNAETGESMTMVLSVVEADPSRRFVFRWCYADDPEPTGPSLQVTFDLIPTGSGTRIRMVENGFREMGWEIAKLEEQYREHVQGWDFYIPRLGKYIERLVATP